jgi:hypothetical protein
MVFPPEPEALCTSRGLLSLCAGFQMSDIPFWVLVDGRCLKLSRAVGEERSPSVRVLDD